MSQTFFGYRPTLLLPVPLKTCLYFAKWINRPGLFFAFLACFCFFAARSQSQPSDSVLNNRLFQSIRVGDGAAAAALLKQGANPNATFKNYSALMAAALNGTVNEMKLLIEHGAEVNYRNEDSISAIWLAVPDEEKTRLLLAHGAIANARSTEGNTVLVKLAGTPGSAAVMQLLIENGCDPRRAGPHNDAMYNAAMSGDTANVGLLIRHGVSVSDTSFYGDYPVNAATNYRSFDVLKMLVEHGAAINVSAKNAVLPLLIGITPLMWAAISNDKPSFYYLLEHGADAKAKTPRGYTPLMFLAMAETDDPEMTLALIRHGADPLEKAPDVTDALFYAQLKGNTKSVELLGNYQNKKQ